MKKWVVYTFLMCYLFSTTELSELLKVDHVFTHFKEHQSASKDLHFSDFIYMHYFEQDFDKNKDEKDKSLPFHSHSEACAINFSIPVVLPVVDFQLNFSIPSSDGKPHFNYYLVTELNSYLDSIWQPPQFV